VSNDRHIVIEGVDMVYERGPQRLHALDGIDLTIGRGEFVSIIGPSGCGKSTLLRIIGGLQHPSEGRVMIDGRPPRDLQRDKQLGFVFQDPSLLPWRNVVENVRLPLQVNRKGQGARAKGQGVVTSSRQQSGGDSAGTLVDAVGLAEFQRYYPHQLSGGMQQRVALARALVTSPSVLLMDEPFGALDELTRTAMRYELMRVWRSAAGDRGSTVIFVTHSIAEAVLLSDRVVVMTPQPGRVAATLDIDLPRPRTEDIEGDPAFVEYTHHLRGLLREHVLA
jgi:NitT/TauT family transport system ATP-binding protein